MKIWYSILILFTFLFISQISFSQSSTFDLNRQVNLYPKDSEDKNIILNVTKNTYALSLNISCKVLLGDLTIELYDPNDVKQGEFSIESQMEGKIPLIGNDENEREVVEGNIRKDISNPIVGNWLIKLIPDKTVARINIKSKFRNKN